jgi:hypothetical protein
MSKPDYHSAAEYANARADADAFVEIILADEQLREIVIPKTDAPELTYEPIETVP